MSLQFIFFGNTSFSSALQREHALAKTLAQKGFQVVFIEGMPSIASNVRARIRQYFSKESIDKLPAKGENSIKNLNVLIPPTVPTFFRSSWTPRYDAWLFRRWFVEKFKNQNWNETVVMVMFPYWWYWFVDKEICPAKIIIYDICDALEMPSRNAVALQRMKHAEQLLIHDANAVTFSAYEMAGSISHQYPFVKQYCLPNAVTETFIQNIELQKRQTAKLIIGYVGFLDPRWADRELLLKVAKKFSHCSLVVRSSMDKSFADRLKENTNVTIIGFQEYSALSHLVSSFTIGIIPFLNNEITAVINPLKLYEYCAAGIPIVAMKTPELNHYNNIIYLAETHDEFLCCIEKALMENDEGKRNHRIEVAKKNTWRQRVDTLLQIIIDDVLND